MRPVILLWDPRFRHLLQDLLSTHEAYMRRFANPWHDGNDGSQKPQAVGETTGNCMLQLIREGLGFGFLPMDIDGLFDDLECVLPEHFAPEIPVWLVSHRELHTSRRIRVVFDLLAAELEVLTSTNT